jgi:hypothetical protein
MGPRLHPKARILLFFNYLISNLKFAGVFISGDFSFGNHRCALLVMSGVVLFYIMFLVLRFTRIEIRLLFQYDMFSPYIVLMAATGAPAAEPLMSESYKTPGVSLDA